MADEKTVTLNGKKITESELERKKKDAEKKTGVSIVKVNENTYKTSIKG